VTDGLAADDIYITVMCKIIIVNGQNSGIIVCMSFLFFFGLQCQRKQLQITPAAATGPPRSAYNRGIANFYTMDR